MANDPSQDALQYFLQTIVPVYHVQNVTVRMPFRVANEMPSCFEAVNPVYLPYLHQQLAFEMLTENDCKSTLIPTGTGSGKTESRVPL